MKNKTLLMTIAILFVALSSVAQETGTFTDSRDGKVYKTVTIGTQTWMAENLAYKADNGCWAYNNDQSNVATYGYLYDWKTAKTVCPSGWHLPSDAEWKTLRNKYGRYNLEYIAGGVLKATSNWSSPNTDATNSSGFTALPGGYRYITGNKFEYIGEKAYWWSSTEYNSRFAWYTYIVYNSGAVYQSFVFSNMSGFSVRCIKD